MTHTENPAQEKSPSPGQRFRAGRDRVPGQFSIPGFEISISGNVLSWASFLILKTLVICLLFEKNEIRIN